MSSVSTSDRANQTDEIRRIREEYEGKESETIKKKNKEIKSLSQKHDAEIDKLKDDYAGQVDTLRSKQTENIDERDRRHNDEISKIRDLYLGNLRKKSEDEMRDRDIEKQTFHSDLAKEKSISEQQRGVIERDYKGALTKKEKLSAEREEKTKLALQEGIRDRTDKLNDKHKAELESLSEGRDREVMGLRNTLENVKVSSAEQQDTEERSHRADTDRRENAFETAYRNQEHNNSEMIGMRDNMLKEEKVHLNAKMGRKIDEETEKMTALRDSYKSDMDGRVGDLIRSANSEAAQARNDRVIDSVTTKRIGDLERGHLMTAYQEREDGLHRERDQIYTVVNEQGRKRVNDVIDRTDKMMADTGRRNRTEQDIERMRAQEALNQSELIRHDQLENANNRADQRVKKVVTTSNQAFADETKQHKENIDELRHTYSDNLQGQREAQLESLNSVYSRMDQKLRDLEAHLMKKHDDAVEFYESKIDDIVTQNKKDVQRMNQNFESRMNQQDKAAKMEQDSVAQKYEQKLAVQDDVHQKDLNRLEKRHQEQLQTVASKAASAQNRKA
jgi:hypothetical protein